MSSEAEACARRLEPRAPERGMGMVSSSIARAKRQTTTRSPSAIAGMDEFLLDYERVGRYGEGSVLRLRFPAAAQERRLLVWLSRSYLESIVLESISPDLRGVQMTRDRVVMCFVAGEDRGLDVDLRFTFDRPGLIGGCLGLVGGSSVSIAQHVLP